MITNNINLDSGRLVSDDCHPAFNKNMLSTVAMSLHYTNNATIHYHLTKVEQLNV